MKKILSLTSKDFETGYSSSSENTKLGLFYSGYKINPFLLEGTLRFSQDAEEIGNGVVVGIPQSFAVNGEDAYSNDGSGNIYKIADVFGIPTVTKPKTGLTNTYGLEVFQTLNSLKYLYYFQKTQIGRMKISDGNFTDNWKAITSAYQSDLNPTIRIDDELFFGSGYVLSKIADNGSTDTELYENQLDLPKDYIITSLSTDGDYIIISASKSITATLDYNETRIFFWDYKNILPSWTRSYTIQDPQIRGMKTVAGVTYAIGFYGLYAFNFSSEPQIVRSDIRSTTGYNNASRIKDAVSFGGNTDCLIYGKLRPGSPTALFKPYTPSIDKISCLDTFSSNTYGLFGTLGSEIYRIALNSTPTTYGGTNFLTGRIGLNDTYDIKRIDVIFSSALASGDRLTPVIQSNSGSSTFNEISFVNNGAVSRATAYPTSGDLLADFISLSISEIYGVPKIKQIDIYGEQVNR